MSDDLISRSALKKSMRKSINERYISWTKTITVADIATLIFDEIEYAPTVEPTDIKPVRDIHDRLICPCCGSRLIDKENGYADRL